MSLNPDRPELSRMEPARSQDFEALENAPALGGWHGILQELASPLPQRRAQARYRLADQARKKFDTDTLGLALERFFSEGDWPRCADVAKVFARYGDFIVEAEGDIEKVAGVLEAIVLSDKPEWTGTHGQRTFQSRRFNDARKAAVEALRQVAGVASIPTIIQVFDAEHIKLCEMAAIQLAVLARDGEEEAITAQMVEIIEAKDTADRAYQTASLTLALVGDERGVPGLVRAMAPSSDYWMESLSISLVHVLKDRALPGLVEQLSRVDELYEGSNDRNGVKVRIIGVIGEIIFKHVPVTARNSLPEMPVIIAELNQALLGPDRWMRRQAAMAIANIGYFSEDTVPNLVQAVLNDSYYGSVENEYVGAVRALGGGALSVFCGLVSNKEIEDEGRLQIIKLLGKVGDERAIPALESVRATRWFGYEAEKAIQRIEDYKRGEAGS